ncbi:hypothetical protein BDZ94DRAFT_1250407 [Collybia nuda]|uniref:N-acetyltransferase ECO1 n=1 Tax=Collybia nuda TaxID=64659 RepID=A0A9P5YDG9_9AGAR|nr:hypothetical protein BDZ94DRAFT_1250407 [Collybia nuda]
MPPIIKHTYSSRQNRNPFPSTSSPPLAKKKRPLNECSTNLVYPPSKRAKVSDKANSTILSRKQKSLTQLHFCIDQPVLRTCSVCGLSYTKGAPDDETLHRAHCSRVQKGMEWGREEDKESTKSDVIEVRSSIKLKDGRKGRIISFRADVGGRIGSKITTLLDTINLTLSSPPLTSAVLQVSKIYLFLLHPQKTTSSLQREKIVGCVIAQRISTAMRIASPAECTFALGQTGDATPPPSPTATLVAVDTGTGLFCHPTPLPTPLGIPRLFVPSTHRRQGIASSLLSAAAATFIHGCPLDPRNGQVAFTQPTGDGHAVMTRWGGGAVRIYEE